MRSPPQIRIPPGQQDEFLCHIGNGDGVVHLYNAVLHVEHRDLLVCQLTVLDAQHESHTDRHVQRFQHCVSSLTHCLAVENPLPGLHRDDGLLGKSDIIVRYIGVDGHRPYLGSECWFFKHDRAVAELLNQAVFSLNGLSDISFKYNK